jgi:hypothetical protein
MKTWITQIVTGAGSALAVFPSGGWCPVSFSAAAGIPASAGLGIRSSKPWFLPWIGTVLLRRWWRDRFLIHGVVLGEAGMCKLGREELAARFSCDLDPEVLL